MLASLAFLSSAAAPFCFHLLPASLLLGSYSLCDANDLPLCEAYWRQEPAGGSPEGLPLPLAAAMMEQSIPAPKGPTPSHPHVNGHGAAPTEHA